LVFINQSLNELDIAAVKRQQQLQRALWFLNPALEDSLPDSAMIPAILQGLTNIRKGKTVVAASWLQKAATTTPYPSQQKAIRVSPWMHIDFESNLVIKGDSPLWRVRSDKQGYGTIQPNEDGSGNFYCQGKTNESVAAFEWNQPYFLDYHHTVQIEAWVEIGTSLILETGVDGQLQRLFTITGTGDWQTATATVTGTNGQLIYLIITQQADVTAAKSCNTQVSAVRFLLDTNAVNP